MSVTHTHTSSPAFDLKGSRLTTLVLHFYRTDNAAIAAELKQKVAQAPSVFKQAPVILDLRAVCNDAQTLDIQFLVEILRSYGILPIGVRGGNPKLNSMALAMGLSLLADSKSDRISQYNQLLNYEEESTLFAKLPPEPQLASVKIIDHPVRSGQQIFSAGDLIILSMVSPGAEILAYRHIHVYGPLRGRALAGIKGDVSARIFCQKLEAELVSVAGQYQINEDLQPGLLGKAAQIYLKEEQLCIEPF
jgi:septum site-determining protein MinC